MWRGRPRPRKLSQSMATEVQLARKIVSLNPATGEILREFESATETDVNAAVAHARAAQPAWNALGVRKRISILREFQRLLHEKKSEVATLITREAGKPMVEALLTEVMVVLDATRFCVQKMLSTSCANNLSRTATWL